MGKQKTTEEFIIEIEKINPNILVVGEYVNSSTPIKIKCKICGYEQTAYPHTIRSGRKCYNCFIEGKRLSNSEFLLRMHEVNPSFTILSEYINTETKVKVRCSNNHEWSTRPRDLLRGTNCPICAYEVRKRIGEENARWNGGISSLVAYLRGQLTDWKKDTMKFSNYKCIITGKNFDDIHHLYSFDKIKDETIQILHFPIYDEINKYSDDELKQISKLCLELHYKYGLGVCITNKEHKLFHKIYGFGNNTPEQFEEFKTKRIQELQIHKNIA